MNTVSSQAVRSALLFLVILISISLPAQKKDSLVALHSPKKAAIFSAILPGAGQVYNHQAWKVPIVYGGMATLGYFIYDNNRYYKEFLSNWIRLTDKDSTTVVDAKYEGVSEGALHNGFSAFRKYRDQCAIGFVMVYIANILDANVYAHLYYFNVDDISVHFNPGYNMVTHSFVPAITLKHTF
jgi:hypothetical protein